METNHHLTRVGLILVLLIAGCMPVPPFSTPVSPEVKGRVVDANSKRPIKGAIIHAERAGYSRTAHALEDGRFTVPSASQWHYLIYLGSPGMYPTPWMFTHGNKDLTMKVEASGYKPKSEVFHTKSKSWDVNMPDELTITLEAQP